MQITILTIRSISYLCLFACLGLVSSALSAATVTVSSYDNTASPAIYDTTTLNAYSNSDVIVNDTSLGTVGENNGEELIFIGASESFRFNNEGERYIDINLFNANDQITGGVSFVLSSAEDMIWNFNLGNPEASKIDINNIYILAQKDQTVNILGETLTFKEDEYIVNEIFSVEQTLIQRAIKICGYSLPYNGGGCNTDQLLGLPNQTINFQDTNPWNKNELGNITSNKVTSFNGSLYVDEVNVTIDTSPIPVPASFLLFLTSILGLITLKKKSKFNL